MKKDKGMKKLAAKASAIAMSIFMTAAMSVPVWADDAQVSTNLSVTSATEENHDCTIELVDTDGNILATYYANAGDTYGPDGTVYVGYSCDAGGKVYQSVNNDYQGTVDSGESMITIQYKEVEEQAPDSTVYILASDTNAIIGQAADESQLKSEVVSGDVTYERNGAKVEKDENGAYVVRYTPSKDSPKSSIVKVTYVTTDDNGNEQTIAEREVSTDLKQFIAPKVFSRSTDGKATYYTAVGKTTIDLQKDITAPLKVEYKEIVDEPYSWYIFLYSSQTNRCIDVQTVEVKPGETASYDAADSITVNGSNYTRNKAFNASYTHEYNDNNHSTYVYYDPEGYSNSSEIQKKTITVQYVDIATAGTGSVKVLQQSTPEVSSDKDTTLTFPDSIDVDGVHYLRVAGQVASVDYNYYSPKNLYTVYYYDENNTEFRTSVITTEEVQEVTVTNGPTTYRVIPGITRTVVTNTDNGISTVLSTNDATGAALITTPAGNIQLGDGTGSTDGSDNTSAVASGSEETTAAATSAGSDDDSAGVSIDGVHVDDIQTPESNVWLNTKEDSSASVRNMILIIIGIAAIAACAIATWLLVRRSKRNHR